jgi:RpiR family transcriptional regulator, carbohydrate utilization regulator
MDQAAPATTNFLARLGGAMPALRRSERKVAELVLREPGRIVSMNLATLSAEADVSEPTTIRFCRALGCRGFPEFKIRVAEALGAGAPFVHSAIEPDEGLRGIVDKIIGSSVDALRQLRTQLDIAAVERAVELIAKAKRIDLIGTGLSSVAAMDAHQKLMRLGVPTIFPPDSHQQRMSAATLTAEDVALAFSYTGQIRDVVRTAELARAQGAALVAVTRSATPLAALATVTIAVDTLENTFVYAPMTTRLAHLAVVDVLATAVALRAGERGAALIARVKRAVQDEWMVEQP